MLHSTIHMFQPFHTLNQFIWNSSKQTTGYTSYTYNYIIVVLFYISCYSSCQDAVGLCSNPSANITLTHQRQLLQSNQPYKIIIDLELPESEANKDLGMFMVQVILYQYWKTNLGVF